MLYKRGVKLRTGTIFEVTCYPLLMEDLLLVNQTQVCQVVEGVLLHSVVRSPGFKDLQSKSGTA